MSVATAANGREPAVGRPPEPAREEGVGRARVAVLPEGAEALQKGPGPTDLEVFGLQGAERGALFGRQVLGSAESQVRGRREPLVAGTLQGPVLAAYYRRPRADV